MDRAFAPCRRLTPSPSSSPVCSPPCEVPAWLRIRRRAVAHRRSPAEEGARRRRWHGSEEMREGRRGRAGSVAQRRCGRVVMAAAWPGGDGGAAATRAGWGWLDGEMAAARGMGMAGARGATAGRARGRAAAAARRGGRRVGERGEGIGARRGRKIRRRSSDRINVGRSKSRLGDIKIGTTKTAKFSPNRIFLAVEISSE